MLNPIIYSFTVKEFKRSALRIIIPTWKCIHQLLPKLIPSPPEHMQRMSRHGHRRNKTRHRSFEMDSDKNRKIITRSCHKRRQTEPAVFALQKKICDVAAEETIMEGEEDVENDEYSESNGFTTFHETSRKLSDLPSETLLAINEDLEPTIVSLNGDCKAYISDDSCSIKVICDTVEADL
ncbi:unnamed protein product [Cylicostephanus goldi]|uniref:Uncharacterized protein n=1 Tax=Cylicostephanus goldi TaxID=71465 RepID=A0A3P6SA99_CYLGO|nr:unnamed protein product [Cylicostephanus goldi]